MTFALVLATLGGAAVVITVLVILERRRQERRAELARARLERKARAWAWDRVFGRQRRRRLTYQPGDPNES